MLIRESCSIALFDTSSISTSLAISVLVVMISSSVIFKFLISLIPPPEAFIFLGLSSSNFLNAFSSFLVSLGISPLAILLASIFPLAFNQDIRWFIKIESVL